VTCVNDGLIWQHRRSFRLGEGPGDSCRPCRPPRPPAASLPAEHEPSDFCRPRPLHRPASTVAAGPAQPIRLVRDVDLPMRGDPHAPARLDEHLRLAAGTQPAAAGARSVGLPVRECKSGTSGRALALGGRNPAGSRRGPVSWTPSTRVQEWHKCVRPVECKRGLSDGITSGPRYADTPAGQRAGWLRRTAG